MIASPVCIPIRVVLTLMERVAGLDTGHPQIGVRLDQLRARVNDLDGGDRRFEPSQAPGTPTP